jgi:putative ABC transport system permease protein
MLTLAIAWRNVLRNGRRTAITLLTIALGGAALLLLGALTNYIVLEFQTSTVRRTGHLALFKTGYFQYGSGNPAAYGIADYKTVIDAVRHDPTISPRLLVATPTQIVAGVAGNYRAGTSKTFFGQGIVPEDRLKMRDWNQHRIAGLEITAPPLADPKGVAIGSGLARILQLCAPPRTGGQPGHCQAPAAAEASTAIVPIDADVADLMKLREREAGNSGAAPAPARPTVEMLAATVGGAPNVVAAQVERVDMHGAKELDDNLVVMHLPLAQQLVYGRGEPRATAINLQLERTEDVPAMRNALRDLVRSKGFDLEVRDLVELNSMYAQTQAFFSFLFGFIALVIVVIVVFTIMNTMGMSVMERVGEIGTARSLGVQRSGIRNLFVIEGALQGLMGATLGVLLAMTIVAAVNGSDISWSPPTSAGKVPFKLYLFGSLGLLGGVWVLLTAVAAVASLIPAHRASRMQIVDALRHV